MIIIIFINCIYICALMPQCLPSTDAQILKIVLEQCILLKQNHT